MGKHRVQLLDSFRFIAMISVLLYHFTSPAVHFSHATLHLPVFKYGYLGVYFFFIISGFVISFTLENTPNISTFYRNRFARLFPPMLLCSVVTFTVVNLLNHQSAFANAQQVRNFLPSLTFTNPNIWARLSGREFHWISGSYWTLWSEVQFYLVASAVYFLNTKKFFRNLLLTGIAIAFLKHIPIYLLNHDPQNTFHAFFESWRTGDELFNLTFFITWFICGAIFYQLYKGLIIRDNLLPIIYVLAILFFLVMDMHDFFTNVFFDMMIAAAVMFAFFLLMIYQDKYLFFLKHRLLYRIGMTSYTAYLVHETIGILLINKYSNYLDNWSGFSPLIIIALVLLFAELSYRIYEKPVSEFLRKTVTK